jgi:hypothetical protein
MVSVVRVNNIYPCHTVCEINSVGAKTVGRERAASDGNLASVHHGRWRGLDILHIYSGSGKVAAGRARAGGET